MGGRRGKARRHSRGGVKSIWKERKERFYERRFKGIGIEKDNAREKRVTPEELHPSRTAEKNKATVKPGGSKVGQKILLSSGRLTLKSFEKRKLDKMIWPKIRVPEENNQKAAEYTKNIIKTSKDICRKRGEAYKSATEMTSTQEMLELETKLTKEDEDKHISHGSCSESGPLPNVRAWLRTAKRRTSEADESEESSTEKTCSGTRRQKTNDAAPLPPLGRSRDSVDTTVIKTRLERPFKAFVANLQMHHSASDMLGKSLNHGGTMQQTRTMYDVQRELCDILKAQSSSQCRITLSNGSPSSSGLTNYFTAQEEIHDSSFVMEERTFSKSHPAGDYTFNKAFDIFEPREKGENCWLSNGASQNGKSEETCWKFASSPLRCARPNFYDFPRRKDHVEKSRRPRPSSLFDGCGWFDELLTTTDPASESSGCGSKSRFNAPGTSGSFNTRRSKEIDQRSRATLLCGSDWSKEAESHVSEDEEEYTPRHLKNFILIREPSPLKEATPPDFLYAKPVRF